MSDYSIARLQATQTQRQTVEFDQGNRFRQSAIVARQARTVVGDSALGAGTLFSKAMLLRLPQRIAPRILEQTAALPRLLGGATTAITSGYRLVNTFLAEKRNGALSFPKTRKEVFQTVASVSAGAAAGSVGGVLTAGAVAVGAPAAVVTGVAGLGLLGVGYAAYKVRNLSGAWYEQLMTAGFR